MTLLRLVSCILLLFFGAQCSWSWLWWWKKKPAYSKGIFSVKIVPWFGKDIPVRAMAFENDDGRRGELVANHLVGPDGVVGFILPMGRDYIVMTWADANRNGKRDPSDPMVTVRGLAPHDLQEQGTSAYLITLPGKGVPPPREDGKTRERQPSADELELEQLKQQSREALKIYAPDLAIPPAPQ